MATQHDTPEFSIQKCSNIRECFKKQTQKFEDLCK